MGILTYPYTEAFADKLKYGEFSVASIAPTTKGGNIKLQLNDQSGRKLHVIVNNPVADDNSFNFAASKLGQIEVDSVLSYPRHVFIASQALFVSGKKFCRLHDKSYMVRPPSLDEQAAILRQMRRKKPAAQAQLPESSFAAIMAVKEALKASDTYRSSDVFEKEEATINLDFIAGHDWFVYTPIDQQNTMELIALGATFATAPKLRIIIAVKGYKPIKAFQHVTPISGKRLRSFMQSAQVADALCLTKKNERADYYYVTITGFGDPRKKAKK